MRQIVELRQYVGELGIERSPPLQKLADLSLQKLNAFLLSRTIPKEQHVLLQARLKLQQYRVYMAAFSYFHTGKDISQAVAEQRRQLFGTEPAYKLTSSLYYYNRELAPQQTSERRTLYEQEKEICALAFYYNIKSTIEGYCVYNSQISAYIRDVLGSIAYIPEQPAREGRKYVENHLEHEDYAQRAYDVQKVYRAAYKIHAQLIVQKNDLAYHLKFLNAQDVRLFGRDFGVGFPYDLCIKDQQEAANTLFALCKGMKAGIEVLRAELRDIELQPPNQLREASSQSAQHCKQKCDIALQSTAKILDQLRNFRIAASVYISQLKGALQAEIFATSIRIGIKQRDLVQVLANYATLETLNFGQLACLQGGEYSCKADADEIMDVCHDYFVNCGLWSYILKGHQITSIGRRCFAALLSLCRYIERSQHLSLQRANIRDITLLWEEMEVRCEQEAADLRREAQECVTSCKNILVRY